MSINIFSNKIQKKVCDKPIMFGWGNWIRTNAHEFRAHCLTAWLYPKNSKTVTAGH